MFPPSLLEAVKLSLLNEPIYHGKLTTELACAKLQKEGEFLIQDYDTPDSLLLSVFKDGVRDFIINIDYTEDGVRFIVGTHCFENLSDLILKLKSINTGKEIIQLGTAIFRDHNSGRFGAHSFIEDKPRVTLKTIIPLPELKFKSVVVALKKEIVHHGIDKELESLILLKHRYLVHLLDFAFYTIRDPVILRYEEHDARSLYDVIRKESVIKSAKTLKWIYQAASLANYLSINGCFHSILCAQDCYLDAGSNIKFRGAWNNSWPSWQEDTLGHAFYWRFVAPESWLYQTHDELSLKWNLGVFMWQLCTNCRLVPFFQYRNRQSFLGALLSGDLELVDHDRNSSSEDLELATNGSKVPQCIRNVISSCVIMAPEQRCLWSDILRICKRESTISSVGGIAKQVFPFL